MMEEFKQWVTESFGDLVHSIDDNFAVIKNDDGTFTTIGREYYFTAIKGEEK